MLKKHPRTVIIVGLICQYGVTTVVAAVDLFMNVRYSTMQGMNLWLGIVYAVILMFAQMTTSIMLAQWDDLYGSTEHSSVEVQNKALKIAGKTWGFLLVVGMIAFGGWAFLADWQSISEQIGLESSWKWGFVMLIVFGEPFFSAVGYSVTRIGLFNGGGTKDFMDQLTNKMFKQ